MKATFAVLSVSVLAWTVLGGCSPEAPAPPPEPVTPIPEGPEAAVWHSPDGCERVVSVGGRLLRESPDALRLAAWNVRWFPWGCAPNETCPERATDVDWLACTLTWMDADLIALQEITTTEPDDPGQDPILARLMETLDRSTGGSWAVDLQDCGERDAQRVGFLWNRDRVELTDFADAWELNGDDLASPSHPCAARLRPGRYARAVGLRPDGSPGADFHVVSVHLDSGRGQLDFRRRRRALVRLGAIEHDGRPLRELDRDVVILGDFNTMGRSDPPDVTGPEEVARFEAELGDRGFRRLQGEEAPYCTEYYRGRAGALDHATVTVEMTEAEVTARVTGVCAVEDCRPLGERVPLALQRLSDHCPVVFEIANEDRDPTESPE